MSRILLACKIPATRNPSGIDAQIADDEKCIAITKYEPTTIAGPMKMKTVNSPSAT